jgi:hypothetical protein
VLAACDSTPVDPGATETGPAGGIEITASVVGAVPVPNETDGHLYDAVAVAGGINWTDARAAAEALTSGSCQGYLASVTSADEDAFIQGHFSNAVPSVGGVGYWIGGYQDPPGTLPADAGWTWVSGETFGYENWLDGQPDDAGDIFGAVVEDAIHYAAASAGGFATTFGWADRGRDETAPGYVVEFDGACTDDVLLEVMLKLSEGEGPRHINLKSEGKIAVAVLSAADTGGGDGFDATAIDPASVRLGDGVDPDAEVAANPEGKLMVSWPDLDGDGLADALFHFNTQDLVAAGLTAGTTELTLRGMTTGGMEFSGTDAVAVM